MDIDPENELILGVGFGECAAATATFTAGVIIPGPTGSAQKWRLESAVLIPEIDVTADPSNYSTLAIANGATALVTARSYATGNSTALTPEQLTITTSAGTALEITENTGCIGLTVTKTGTGVKTQPRVSLRFKKVR